MDTISERRESIYEGYDRELRPLQANGQLQLPVVPDDCKSNFHMYFVLMATEAERDQILDTAKAEEIGVVFHYVPLHSSPMGKQLCGKPTLTVTEGLSSRLVRLPFFHEFSTITANTRDRVFLRSV